MKKWKRWKKEIDKKEEKAKKEKVEKDEIREKLKSIDPLHMTPLEAMNVLFELKEISND